MEFTQAASILLVMSSMVTSVVLSSPIVFHVTEELSSGTLVGNVKTSSNVSQEVSAEDLDSLQFHILSADGLRITSIFSINSKTGAIYTNAMIDREQLCDLDPVCQLEFDVTVKIDTNFLKLLTVRIIVDDVNDNAPTFPKGELNLTVTESAPVNSEIPISGALDKDAGLNTTISYSLQVSSVFGLKEVKQLDGSSTLKLVVQQSLDREAVSSYSFLILAADGRGPEALTGTLSVTVLVSDVNDNAPKFSKDSFRMTVMETAPVGTVFGHLTASDGDVGLNGQLTFRFSRLTNSEITDLFSLNSTTGELSVAGGLQYESGRTFQCVVQVMDLGVPPQVSQANLRIVVEDAGNTPPKLDLILADPVYGDQTAMLSEDVQVDTFVGTLKTEDLDQGPEGEVTCSSQDSHFALQDLDTNRYKIVVHQTLDRERQQEMNVVLLCKDNGDPRLTSTTTFKVIVRDINDNAPEFTQRVFRASLTENGSGEQYVTQVTATDRDDSTNSIIAYSLAPQSTIHFSINSVTGRITTLSTFDRETTPSVNLTVYARDSGSPALTGSTTVSVRIADVNDNPPYVIRSDYYVSENLRVGQSFNVSVADLDEGKNGTVRVWVPANFDASLLPFSVLSNGSLQVKSALDREERSSYTIPLILTDLGSPPLSSTTTLTIQLVDSNDHTPLFLFPNAVNNSVTVMAEVPVGSHVCRIKAEDGDLGQNGVVTYFITGGNSGQWMAVNNLTGDIFTVRSLSSLAGSSLSLQVTASDQGLPPLVTQTLLEVVLKPNHTALLPGQGSHDEEDRYIIIAGVLAGVTFVIAVVVIAVIVHMRTSDLRRQEAMRNKMRKGEEGGGKMHKLSVLCPNGVVLSDAGKSGTPESCEVEGTQGLAPGVGTDRGGFQSLALRGSKECGGGGGNGDMLDFQDHPSLAGFPEQASRNRLVSEDHNSDTSGDTTTCDSGRGASDEEIVYPVNAKMPATTSSGDPPPRIPPRQPLPTTPTTPHWSRDAHVVSTNWSDPPYYVTTEEETSLRRGAAEEEGEGDELSFLSGDFRYRSRKGPLRVHFSFDKGDAQSRSVLSSSGGMENENLANHPDLTASHINTNAGGQPYPAHYSDRGHPNARASSSSSSPLNSQAGPHPRDFYLQDHKNFAPGSRGSSSRGDPRYRHGQDLRLNPESLYPRLDRFPRKEKTPHSGGASVWEGHHPPGATRTSESVSSLVHGVDDEGSTTTSGSYSIGSEDAMNVSLEC